MTKYNTFVLSVIIFAVAFCIGARTYHPAYLIEYKAYQEEIATCERYGGNFTVNDNHATCQKITVLFDLTLNDAYLK